MIKIRCSELERVLNCAHSLRLPRFEMQTDKHAIEGRLQHAYAHTVLAMGTMSDELSPNTIKYIEFVKSLKGEKHYEEYLEYEAYGHILTGTSDAVIYNENESLHIVDLKTGYQEVDPFCDQLKGYALLWYNKFYNDSRKYQNIKIYLSVVQNEEITTVTLHPSDILELSSEINKSLSFSTFDTGPHCKYCPSKIHCLKMHAQVKNANENENFIDMVRYKSEINLIDMVRYKSAIENTLKEAKEYLIKTHPEYFRFVARRNKRWIDESIAPTYQKAMTPAQALKENLQVSDNIEIKETYTHILKENIQC